MTTFNAATEQFGDVSKTAVDTAIKFAQVSLSSAERLVALNLEAAKVGFDVTAQNAKAAVAIKDPQEFNALRTKAAETGMEFAMGYSKNFYDVATSTQAQFSSLMEERVGQFQQSMSETLEKVSKASPAGADAFVNAMKTSLAASAAATDNFTKAAKQMSTFADSAIKNATETAQKATVSATKAAPKRK
jgi:phasin family protein